jgi:hypothetical protein
MSVTAVGELPLPEHVRRPNGFFGASNAMCVVRFAPARCHGSASWVRKARGGRGAGGDWIAICCPEITKQRDGYSGPFRAEYRLREVGDLNQLLRVALWTRDPQLLHPVGESRPLEAQASCRSPITSDDPIAFAEYPHDLLALGLQQRVATDNRALI